MEKDLLLKYALAHGNMGEESDVLKADCDIIIYLLEHCQITFGPEDRFFGSVNCGGVMQKVIRERLQPYIQQLKQSPLWEGHAARAYSGSYDFGHTSAQWESVISLGIFGLRCRIAEYREYAPQEKHAFYDDIGRVYDAALRFMKRAAAEAARCGKREMAEGLEFLSENPPENLFQAMQTSVVYYILQQMFDGTILRTMGRLDRLFYPFFVKEDREVAEALLLDYIRQIDRFEAAANIPFAICGSDLDGRWVVNELSYLLLRTYQKAGTVNTKLHLLYVPGMPDDIVELALDGVRHGDNSIVFMSDPQIIRSLEKLGADHVDAVNYHVVGCYECGAEGELTCSCNARVNIPKALELTLNDGVDMLTGIRIGLANERPLDSFENLYAQFQRQLAQMCRCAMEETDIFEPHYAKLHGAPILSGTYLSALERGEDLYCGQGAKYNNSSLNAIGLATAADSLCAIRKLVYEDGTVTLAELVELLKNDWAGAEALRLRIKNKFPKFGMGDARADALAKDIADTLAYVVSGKPNKKKGCWRLGLFSIDWRWELGEKCAASADGRKTGETLSQNSGATFGADREGATAHLLSVASIDSTNTPNGTIADLDLHTSAVRGSNGLRSMVATLKTYFDLGGFAVHYNVLDTQVLREAKAHPDRYPNLQVRLCGWNVLFNTLSEREKDDFIARSVTQEGRS